MKQNRRILLALSLDFPQNSEIEQGISSYTKRISVLKSRCNEIPNHFLNVPYIDKGIAERID